MVGWTRCGVSASQRATIDVKEGMKAGSLLSHVKYAKPIGEKLRRMYGTMTNRGRYTLAALAAMDLGSGPCSYLFF